VEEKFVPKVVLALIEHQGQFVLIKRRVPSQKLDWAFPGGVTEPHETEEESVVREARQEVGLEVVVKEKLLERKHPNTLVNLVYFHCTPVDFEANLIIGEPDEISEVRWVKAENVLGKFTSDVHPLIRQFVLEHEKK
jgi:8-oxo-dGTP pyrophosphatase MutT (NUDIX family)